MRYTGSAAITSTIAPAYAAIGFDGHFACLASDASIGGQSAQYLTNALMEYRAGKRKHPTMQAQAQSFSEQDIADIAAYLSSIK